MKKIKGGDLVLLEAEVVGPVVNQICTCRVLNSTMYYRVHINDVIQKEQNKEIIPGDRVEAIANIKTRNDLIPKGTKGTFIVKDFGSHLFGIIWDLKVNPKYNSERWVAINGFESKQEYTGWVYFENIRKIIL